MAHATAIIGAARYKVDITTGEHRLIADEGPGLGGQDAGPAPYDLLLSGLGACTAITLKMYAERKEWSLKGLSVDLKLYKDGDRTKIHRTLHVEGVLDADQRARLADIAERTPVTLTLKAGADIQTELAPLSD
jgi:putative redox protein